MVGAKVSTRVVLAVSLGLLLASQATAQEVYKRRDASGRVVYSDRPPSPGEKAEPLHIQRQTEDERAESQRLYEAGVQQREQKRAEERERAEQAARDERCRAARETLRMVQDGKEIVEVVGGRVVRRMRLDGAGREAALRRLEAEAQDACKVPMPIPPASPASAASR